MIPFPDAVLPEDMEAGLAVAAAKAPQIADYCVRLLRMTEGLSLQILHVGADSDVSPVLEQLYSTVMPTHNLDINGPYHEIYLTDPRQLKRDRFKIGYQTASESYLGSWKSSHCRRENASNKQPIEQVPPWSIWSDSHDLHAILPTG